LTLIGIMRFPQAPDRCDWLERTIPLLRRGGLPDVEDHRYLHWDEVRRRKPPDGLSLEEWWALLRWGRERISRRVPFSSTDGESFWYAQTSKIERALQRCDRETSGSIQISDDVLNSESRGSFLFKAAVEEAFSSSVIEGAVTTRLVARDLIREERRPRDISEQMVLNNYRTMQWLKERLEEPLSPGLMAQLQEQVTESTLERPEDAGRFRSANDPVEVVDALSGETVFSPCPADLLPERLAKLCAWINEDSDPFVHPVVQSILLHFFIAYEHPFVDGNGRTARALFHWLLLKRGYWLFEFLSPSREINEHRGRYYRSFLNVEYGESDLTYFIHDQIDRIEAALDYLVRALSVEKTRRLQLERELRGLAALNDRQSLLIRHALRHPEQIYTAKSHANSHQVTTQTARNDLTDLERRGLLRSGKRGRQIIWKAVGTLREKLQK
jgi:Fic family protein